MTLLLGMPLLSRTHFILISILQAYATSADPFCDCFEARSVWPAASCVRVRCRARVVADT
eukprot:6164438-Pyramimonas_sp.AAC.1